MRLSAEDRHYIEKCLRGVRETHDAQRMKTFIQHGHITTYEHVMNVVCMSYELNKTLHLHADRRSLVLGAFLHDFYLYDWHDPTSNDGLHGFRHPVRALEKAQALFPLNAKERNIIESHMWPLTLVPPKYPEAWVVTSMDKYCATIELLYSMNENYRKRFHALTGIGGAQ